MSIYHKIVKLSIAVVSLATLMFNFLFPHVVIAKGIGNSTEVKFDFSKKAEIISFAFNETNPVLPKASNINVDSEKNGSLKLFMLPIEMTVESINDKITENICAEAGLADLPCWQDLKAMREKESYNGKAMVGDSGRSRGWYHIQTKLHNVSVECALDLKCSTEWTVKNLITNGYKTNRSYAISRHNGSGVMAQAYARSVVYNSAKIK